MTHRMLKAWWTAAGLLVCSVAPLAAQDTSAMSRLLEGMKLMRSSDRAEWIGGGSLVSGIAIDTLTSAAVLRTLVDSVAAVASTHGDDHARVSALTILYSMNRRSAGPPPVTVGRLASIYSAQVKTSVRLLMLDRTTEHADTIAALAFLSSIARSEGGGSQEAVTAVEVLPELGTRGRQTLRSLIESGDLRDEYTLRRARDALRASGGSINEREAGTTTIRSDSSTVRVVSSVDTRTRVSGTVIRFREGGWR